MFGALFDAVTQPLRDTVDVLDGLTEGEIRTRAIARLGVDAIVGLTAAEIINKMAELSEFTGDDL